MSDDGAQSGAAEQTPVLITGLPGAGKTTLLARLYADSHSSRAADPEWLLSFPGPPVDDPETLRYLEERWEWIQRNFDERCKTTREVDVRFDVTRRGRTRRFVTCDVPGEVFRPRTRPEEDGEVDASDVERIQDSLREKIGERLFRAAVIVVSAADLLSEHGAESSVHVGSIITAVCSERFGARDLPVVVAVTHMGDTGVDATELRTFLFGDAERSGQAESWRQTHDLLSIVCLDSLHDLAKNPETGLLETPSAAPAGLVAGDTAGAVDVPKALVALLDRQRRRKAVAKSARAAGLLLLLVAVVLAALLAADWLSYRNAAARADPIAGLEDYLDRPSTWGFKLWRDQIGRLWAAECATTLNALLEARRAAWLTEAEEFAKAKERAPYAWRLAEAEAWRRASTSMEKDIAELRQQLARTRREWDAAARADWPAHLVAYRQSLPVFAPYERFLREIESVHARLWEARLGDLYRSARGECDRTRSDPAALPAALESAETFVAAFTRFEAETGAPGTAAAAWRDEIEARRNDLRRRKQEGDQAVVEAKTLLARLEYVEDRAKCVGSFREAGLAVRKTFDTYRETEGRLLWADWVAKLKQCVATLSYARARPGFEAACALTQLLDQLADREKDWARRRQAELLTLWAEFEFRKLSDAVEGLRKNQQHRAGLRRIEQYLDETGPWEKRRRDAENLQRSVVGEWNQAWKDTVSNLTADVRNAEEFDGKRRILDSPDLPPEALRVAELRELIVQRRRALGASYERMIFGRISGLVQGLPQGSVDRWDRFDEITGACRDYVADARIPEARKANLEWVRNCLAGLERMAGAPSVVRIESVEVWGTKHHLDDFNWPDGAYFRLRIEHNRKSVHTSAEDLPEEETKREGMDVYWASDPVKKSLEVRRGDSVVIELATRKTLLLRECLDFDAFTPVHFLLKELDVERGALPQRKEFRTARVGIRLKDVSVQDQTRFMLQLPQP